VTRNLIRLSGAALLALCSVSPVSAKTETGSVETAEKVDPDRMAEAQKAADRLIPNGTYQRMMKDVADQMTNGMLAQMMGMNASDFAVSGKSANAGDVDDGKTLGDIAAEKDPHFKERMDITMKVIFAEMGKIMNGMEPVLRSALARSFGAKYSLSQLTDINGFFATPSGSVFAADFMATFTDKEVMRASMEMTPKLLETMPEIIKKIETATKHLPPVSNGDAGAATHPEDGAITDALAAIDAATAPDDGAAIANETGNEPWHDEKNWSGPVRAGIKSKLKKSEKNYAAYEAAYAVWEAAQNKAVAASRANYKAAGWKPEPGPITGTIETAKNADDTAETP
jgi:hypothetical protein